MEKYYEELNAKCQDVAKEVIGDNSILSDNMLKAEEREFLLSDWNAFLIGLIIFRNFNFTPINNFYGFICIKCI